MTCCDAVDVSTILPRVNFLLALFYCASAGPTAIFCCTVLSRCTIATEHQKRHQLFAQALRLEAILGQAHIVGAGPYRRGAGAYRGGQAHIGAGQAPSQESSSASAARAVAVRAAM